MKRASYREAIKWIADEDEPTIMDPEVISGFISVLLIADIFDVSSKKVAADVLKQREKL